MGGGIFLTQFKVREEKQSCNTADAVFSDITDLEEESVKVMYFHLIAMFVWIVLMMQL